MDTQLTKLKSRRPIHLEEVRSKSKDISFSDNSDSYDESTEEEEAKVDKRATKHKTPKTRVEEKKIKKLNEQNNYKQISYILIIFLVPILLTVLYLYPNDTDEEIEIYSDNDIERLKYQFPSQEEDFWINIKVAVEEVINLNQPKSIIFLYEHDKPIQHILLNISEYASSKILSNLKKPIVVNSEDLNRRDILEDYGVFITDIKEKLQNSAVVIVNNLDNIPSKAAQAFHSLCDEYNPIQEKVLYLFTIKDDTFPDKLLNFVENKLRKRWSDMHSDQFYPLITRMSSFILKVQ